MEFIASRDAVLFLAQSAPAAWVYRALLWMVQSGELNLYADRVEVAARSSVFDFVAPLNEEAGEWSGSAMDAAIRRKYPAELAEKLVGKDTHDEIEDESQIVEGWDSIGALDIGFLIYYSKFDWSKGLMECDYIDNDLLRTDWLFSSQEFVWSDFLNPTYSVKFEGLKFDANRIELLLPSAQLTADLVREVKTGVSRHVGRPRKWDWDGAMAHIVAMAQTPDGLPTGHGAQSKVEAMIAQWFEAQTGDSPATSQIRIKASRIMEMVEKG